jgi:nitrogen fixation NifU-like protein
MSSELYQTAIMSEARAAHGKGRLADADASATRDNPLCGDRVTLDIKLADGRIQALAHDVRGCALCQAAASLIGTAAPGLAAADAAALPAAVEALLAGGAPPDGAFAKLAMFTPVRAHRSRFDCVKLPFLALAEACSAASAKP